MAAFTGKHVLASFPGTGNNCHRTIGRIHVLKEAGLWLSPFLLVVFLANLCSVSTSISSIDFSVEVEICANN